MKDDEGPRRGGGEIVEGLLIAFVGAPVVGVIVATLLIFTSADFGTVFMLAAWATFAYGAIRAGHGARIYVHNIETAALLTIRDAELSWERRHQD